MVALTTSKAKGGQTPLMRQYYAVKERHPGTVLLFRMGDFYETFGSDAEEVHAVLGITLTKRSNGSASETSLAGFPYHSLDTYLPKLVKAGYRVAICEQLEEASKGKSLVDRDVVEIVTPGVIVREELLDPKQATYIASVFEMQDGIGSSSETVFGIAFADASTGEFKMTQARKASLGTILRGINPAEIVCLRKQRSSLEALGWNRNSLTSVDDWVFGDEYAVSVLTDHFGVHSLKGFGIDLHSSGVLAAGGLLHYLQETQKGPLPHIRKLERHDQSDYMSLDVQTLRNLELVSSSGGPDGALVTVLDQTMTPMGARLLRRWLVRPLKEVEPILTRQRIVESFTSSRLVRETVRKDLSKMGDLERIAARICTERVTPRDLASLRSAFEKLPSLSETLFKAGVAVLTELSAEIKPSEGIVQLIRERMTDEPPAGIKEGGIIRAGFSSELDELRSLSKGGKEWLKELTESEIIRTGIPSLKISYNKVFGFYIEITHVHKAKVPDNYIRKQTLVNAERYITPELKEYEEKILGAEERRLLLEQQLFQELREQLSTFSDQVFENASVLAKIDVLACLSEVAVRNKFVKPLMHGGLDLEIEDGRHPVVERSLSVGQPFVPNSVSMSTEKEQILIITGPNMAGKSVVLRQVGLIVLLAQMGGYVPAKRARIGVVDRIFTRVGASDNLSAGESTFLVEMNETANILNNATHRSLILLDEVGRGTSTFDGLSIAWALVEYVHSTPSVAARTLFATHYHELNELENRLERVRNYRILVQEHNGKVVFLRKMVRGGADHSYGIEVARMAGLPPELLDRSKQILNQLEQQELEVGDVVERIQPYVAEQFMESQMSLFGMPADPRLEEMKNILTTLDPNSTTPIDALLLLTRLHQSLSE
ncbi:MAG: DNA mismatch repair protein MutS [Bacteroidetes bacterium]|nr:DNA mismatch repair protein MutS [Bacteroidota bacterium]